MFWKVSLPSTLTFSAKDVCTINLTVSFYLACEQAFGRAGNWKEGKAKRPVKKHLPFRGTRRASDPDASSYWREH